MSDQRDPRVEAWEQGYEAALDLVRTGCGYLSIYSGVDRVVDAAARARDELSERFGSTLEAAHPSDSGGAS